MNNNRRHFQHYHTKNNGSIPSVENIYDGEIAVNMSDGDEQLFIKNTNNQIINFKPAYKTGNIISEIDEDIVLDDVDSNTYVKYVAQTLTDEQKAQARTNINALSQNNIKTINGESIVGSGDLTIEGGAKVYTWNWDGKFETVTLSQEEYDNIVEADIVVVNTGGIVSFVADKSTKEFSEAGGYYFLTGQLELQGVGYFVNININISTKLATITLEEQNIPTKTSQLENDSNFISSDNLKTINGESIVGTGDIVISGGSGDYLPLTGGTLNGDLNIGVQYILKSESGYIGGPYTDLFIDKYSFGLAARYNGRTLLSVTYAGDGTKFLSDDGTYKEVSGGSSSGSSAYSEVSHGTADTTFTLTPNTFHIWDEVSSLTLTLGAETSGVANEYLFQFTSGSEPTTLSLPDDIKWTGGETLTIEANKIYQVSILKGLGSVLEWNSVSLIENKLTLTDGDMTSGSVLTFAYPTASELTLTMQYYSSDTLIVPSGTTSITIDWFEPMAPQITSINPISDSTYKYIM